MRLWPLLLAVLALGACRDDLERQPKLSNYEPTTLWDDGAAARPFVEGTVARGMPDPDALLDAPEVDLALLQRGQERYEINCSPCHGLTGEADGRVVQRGFPPPPSFLSARLREAKASHFVEVITEGYGIMYAYNDRVSVEDRWAIAAYIRALQAASPKVAEGMAARDAVPVGGAEEGQDG